MSRDPNFNAIERASFALQPETCPAIDAAFDRGIQHYDEAVVMAALAGNRVEPTPAIVAAVREAIQRHLFPALKLVEDAAKYEGTYLLRLALIRQLERNAGLPRQDSIFEHWLQHRPPSALRTTQPADGAAVER